MRAVAAGLSGMAGVGLLLASVAIWATQDLPVDPIESVVTDETSSGQPRVNLWTTELAQTADASMNRVRPFFANYEDGRDSEVPSTMHGERLLTRVAGAVAGTIELSPSASATPTESPTPSASATPTASPWPTATLTPRPPFVWPGQAAISQPMAENHPYGIDIGVRYEPVYAVRDGRVTFVGGDSCCSYGLFVVIEHDQGWTSLYAHLEAFSVGVGDNVVQGERIGGSGETGNSRGPHLHFELRSWGTPVDPLVHLPAR